MLNLPLHKRGGGSLDAQIDRHLAEQRRAARADYKARREAAAAKEAARVRLTVEDVKGARFVRDSCGWHEVVRVSAKSVTVETGYSWTDRIALEKILEVWFSSVVNP
jgi:hypothetical protein